MCLSVKNSSTYLIFPFPQEFSFTESLIFFLPLVYFFFTCLPGKVSISASLRQKGDKWAEEQARDRQWAGAEWMRESRADAKREKAANGSLKVDIMRIRGEERRARTRLVKGRNKEGWCDIWGKEYCDRGIESEGEVINGGECRWIKVAGDRGRKKKGR